MPKQSNHILNTRGWKASTWDNFIVLGSMHVTIVIGNTSLEHHRRQETG